MRFFLIKKNSGLQNSLPQDLVASMGIEQILGGQLYRWLIVKMATRYFHAQQQSASENQLQESNGGRKSPASLLLMGFPCWATVQSRMLDYMDLWPGPAELY